MIDINSIPKISCVYKIVSPIGKIYIGKTKHLKNRFLKYSSLNCKQQKKLYLSLLKYGFSNHSYEILFISENPVTLNEREIFFIKEFKTFNNNQGLNLTEGGDGRNGFHNDKTKQKISNSLKNSIKHKETMSSKEYRKKLSDSLVGHPGHGRGVPRNEEVKKKISEKVKSNLQIYGSRNHTQESKIKMSKFRKGEGNGNSKKCKIIYNGKILEFNCQKYIKYFFIKINSDLNLKGRNRYSYDGLFKKGFTNDIKLI